MDAFDYDRPDIQPGYDESRRLSGKTLEPWLVRLSERLPEGPATVVDPGCGTGCFSVALGDRSLSSILPAPAATVKVDDTGGGPISTR